MSKQLMKKATLNDFLAKKLKKEENANKTLDIKVTSMDRVLVVKKPTDEEILDYLDDIGEDKSARVAIEQTMKLFYRKCPELQNTELHESLEIKDPYDVINVLFDMEDKNEIMEQFATLLGKIKEVDKEIKNSSSMMKKRI